MDTTACAFWRTRALVLVVYIYIYIYALVLYTAVCPSALGRLARVSHQQLMAGATQLAVTGAFARASLSAAVYQLRLTRKPRSESIYVSRKERRKCNLSAVPTRLSRRYAIPNSLDGPSGP